MTDRDDNRYRDDDSARRPDAPRGRSPIVLAAFAIAVLAALAAALAGPGSRIGLWEFRSGFTILKWASYVALAAAGLGAIGALTTRPIGKRRGFGFALLAILVGLVTAYVPWSWRQRAESVPPIHDISTDTINPPGFVAILPLRSDAPNPPEYGGDSIAQQQKAAYPEVGPLALDAPPERAFAAALDAARGMGWEIVGVEPAEGRIEATDTTFWFGFKDDVVVRVTAAAGGSRIDVRSVSRVGRSDVGTNAERIREYLERIRESV
jgi:uncharacterized protein (DUF1499 family)